MTQTTKLEKSYSTKIDAKIKEVLERAGISKDRLGKFTNGTGERNIDDILFLNYGNIKSMGIDDVGECIWRIKKYLLNIQAINNEAYTVLNYLRSKKKEVVAYGIKEFVENTGDKYGWNERVKICEDNPSIELIKGLNEAILDYEIVCNTNKNIIERIDEICSVFNDRKFYLLQERKIHG